MNIHILEQYKKRDSSLKLPCSNLQGLLSNYLKKKKSFSGYIIKLASIQISRLSSILERKGNKKKYICACVYFIWGRRNTKDIQ